METVHGEQARVTLASLLGSQRIVALTTRNSGGQLFSRPMYLCLTSEDAVWFFTHGSNRISRELEFDEHVSVNGRSDDGSRFVSVSGRARLSGDTDIAERLWDPALEDWFPGGLGYPGIQMGMPGLQLINVVIDYIEYWENGFHHRVASPSSETEASARDPAVASDGWVERAQLAHVKASQIDSEGRERILFEEGASHRNPDPDEVRVLMAYDEPPD